MFGVVSLLVLVFCLLLGLHVGIPVAVAMPTGKGRQMGFLASSHLGMRRSTPLRMSSIDTRENAKFADWSKQALRWGWGWNEKKKLWTNWHNIVKVSPANFDFPTSKEEIIALLKEAREMGQKVKVVGTGCSPNSMAVCKDRMISTEQYKQILNIDKEKKTVTVQAGVTLAQLNEELPKHGLGLSVLTSISDQAIGGALACAIHGTGVGFSCLPGFVESLEIILADGTPVRCSERENPDLFQAARCHIGALGVISEVTLKCEDMFKLRARQKPVPLEEVLNNLDSKVGSSEHWRFWWFPHTDMCVEWGANRVPLEMEDKCEGDWIADQFLWFNYALETALFVTKFFPPLIKLLNKACQTVAFTTRADTVNRSDRVFNFDCLFRQYVDEWSIPKENCPEAMRRLKKFIDSKSDWGVHWPVEVRFTKKDDIWLSPSYGHDSCWIGVIMYKPWNTEPPEYWKEYFRGYEEIMDSLGGRPHWAKEHRLAGLDFENKYEKFDQWRKVREKVDPEGMFVNDYVARVIDSDRFVNSGIRSREGKGQLDASKQATMLNQLPY
mmetsp:Transcript_28107/g.55040  ORF Transcript_28107/g.55040 Transcript_28107/m.55040 type:complete len:554 (-) Transcript_28107:64-1725(-)